MKRLAALALSICALSLCLLGVGCSQATGSVENAITVSATGTAQIAPDKADFQVLVDAQGATVEEAQANAARIAGDITARLKTAGAEEGNISVQNSDVTPRYGGIVEDEVMGGYYDWDGYWVETGPEVVYYDLSDTIVGYDMVTTINVSSVDVDSAATMLKESVAAGATGFGSITYSISDREAAYQAALGAAVDAAHTKAETLASASKVYVGRVVNMVEQSDAASLVLTAAGDSSSFSAGDTSTLVVEPAPIAVSASVTVSYAIS